MSIENGLYRILFESSSEARLILEPNGRIVDVNNKALVALTVSKEELLEKSLFAVMPSSLADGRDPSASLQEILENSTKWHDKQFEWGMQLVDGETIPILMTFHWLKAEGKELILATLERGARHIPAAEAELERQRAILENVQDGYYEVDLTGTFVFVNQAVCEMFGHSEEELLGMNFQEYMDRETIKKVFEVFHKVFRTGKPRQSLEHSIISRNTKTLWIQTSISLLRNAQNRPFGFRGFVRDITDRKHAESLLLEAHHNLEQRVSQRTAALAESNVLLEAQITERRHAEEEIKRRHQSQEVLNKLLQLSSEDISFREQLQKAFDLILSTSWLSTLQKGSIFLVEDNRDELVLQVHRGLEPQLLSKCARVPFGTCLCGLAAKQGKTLHVNCLDHQHEYLFDGMSDHGHYNIPILIEGTVAGVINLYLVEGHERDSYEVDFLEAVANALGNLIKRRRVEQKYKQLLEQRARQVQLSTQVAQGIAAAANLDELYHRVVWQIKEQFNYYYAQLLRYDPALDTIALVVGYGEVGEKMLAMHHSIPMGVGLIGAAAATGQSKLSADVSEDPAWQSNPLLPRTKGELAVPIKMGDSVLGVLDVQSETANALNEEDLLLLEGLCGQIAVAIESTRLQQDMASRLRELDSLQRYMSREGWQRYRSSGSRAKGYQFDHAGAHPISTEFPAFLDADSVPANGETDALFKGASTLENPLIVRGETIGTLAVVDNPDNPLSEEEQQLLASIAEQVAESLEIARLFEQTQQSLTEQERLASELETVAQVSTAASTVLDVDSLLQSVVDLAKTSFDLYHAHVYLFNEDEDVLVLRAGADSVGRLMVLEGREIGMFADSLVARAARDREGFFENDVRKAIDFLPHPLLPNTRSELAVPMIVGEVLVGILDLQSDQVGFFSHEHLQIQKTLAAQIAVAVQNAFRFAEQVETAFKLRQVDQLKSEFLASMSHELRTPLNSIIGFADVLLEGLDGELNERMEEDVRLIRDSGAHLRSLIGDILDMTKIEAGRMELRYEEVDMQQMANDILATASPLAQEKTIDLYLNLAADVDIIEADRTRLRQVLWNIVGNAIKFTEEGYVTLSMQMKDDNLLVAVRDTGVGIEADSIPIVFEQFRQVDGSLNRSVGGTGLGMPITKNLVELHGGEIWVESVFGQGSTFWFTVPRYKVKVKRDTALLPNL